MPEFRDRKLMVGVEPIIHELVLDLTTKEDRSISSYVRTLIIKDLMDRGLLTDDHIKTLVLA